MELSPELAQAIDLVIAAPQAWVTFWTIEAVVGAEGIAELVALGWLVVWDRPDYRALTLTPLGAYLKRVVVAERRAKVEGVIAEDVPYWEDSAREPRPVRLPKEHRTEPLRFPERIVDHRAAEPAIDETSGEPMVLFTATMGGGWPVSIDRRLGKKSKGKGKAKGKR